ncbi:MAG: Flp family type IVb pilin [Burkholderiales bacterium]|nr:Flp family type IVb pilin [Burkholderiales bacterium]
MKSILNIARQFWNDEEGATAVEYGLLAALIAIAIIVGVNTAGTNLNALFNRIAACLTNPRGALCGV